MSTAAKRVRLRAPTTRDQPGASVVSIRLTTKRQATFPKELCDGMRLVPGDRIELEHKVVDGEPVWVLRKKKIDWSFIGSLKPPKGISHDMDDIRESIARGWGREKK